MRRTDARNLREKGDARLRLSLSALDTSPSGKAGL